MQFSSGGPRPGPAQPIAFSKFHGPAWPLCDGPRARPGPYIFHSVGRGPARPIQFSSDGPRPGRPIFFSKKDGPRPGPAHSIFKISRPGLARPIIFQTYRPGPARPVTLAARPMSHGLCTGRPAISVGRSVDLTGRATGRPICCPVLKGEGLCADVFFFVFFFPRFFPSGFRVPMGAPPPAAATLFGFAS